MARSGRDSSGLSGKKVKRRAVIEIGSDEKDSDEPSSSSAGSESEEEEPVLHIRSKASSSTSSLKPAPARKDQVIRRQIVKTLGPDDEIVSIKNRFKTPDGALTYTVKLRGVRGEQRVPADDLHEYPDLVEAYERKQRGSQSGSNASEEEDDEQADEEADWDGNEQPEEESEEEQEIPTTRRSVRGKQRKTTPPPPPEPTRRSSRARRSNKLNYEDPQAVDVDPASDDDEDDQPVPATRSGRSRREPQSPKKTIGLNWNTGADSGEEEPESTQLHRPDCEKCHLLSAAEIWALMHKTKRRRKKDELSDEEILALGSWVECGQCAVSYHFACLPKSLQGDIIRTLKAEAEEQYAAEDGPDERNGAAQEDTKDAMDLDEPAPPKSESRRDRSVFVISDSEEERDTTSSVSKPKAKSPSLEVEPQTKKAVNGRTIRLHKKEEDISQSLTIEQCPMCARVSGTTCFKCQHTEEPAKRQARDDASAQKPDRKLKQETSFVASTSPNKEGFVLVSEEKEGMPAKKDEEAEEEEDADLLFRCSTCKRPAHYACMLLAPEESDTSRASHSSSDVEVLPPSGPAAVQEVAQYYQSDWRCDDCDRWTAKPDVILAWRPLGYDKLSAQEIKNMPRPTAKDPLVSAEYYVKWQEMSYRRAEWVPHAFLAATANARLRNFLDKGSELRDAAAEESKVDEDEGAGQGTLVDLSKFGRAPNVSADKDIPKDWLTIERVINCTFKAKNELGFSTAEDAKNLSSNPKQSIGRVYQALVKWQSLPYSECTWESFSEDDEDWDSFYEAYFTWLWQKDVIIPDVEKSALRKLDQPRKKSAFEAVKQQPSYMGGPKSLKLMKFQMQGVTWLYFKWWVKQGGILSDEMGLGKTVQIISFLSLLFEKEECQPFLVVVPNSTIGNWVREFATWGPPRLKVVPYFGSAASRRTIKENELFPSPGLHAHVVICTYESVTNDIAAFNKVQRWDSLIVDEAQRLKGGETGNLFKALRSLNIGNRFLLTGTPLNNSVAEIFNLMAFIDPHSFPDLHAEQAKYETLTPKLVKELRERLEPYFLRRTKDQVLSLPPLGEVIVPVSLRPLQKQVYKSILAKNVESIESLYRGAKGTGQGKKASFNNILIQLRQCCQSPYLNAPDIEPLDVTPAESHRNMTEASGKLTFLTKLIPKLIDGGHRILIFSQFLGALDILNRFLEGMGVSHVSLSGSSTQGERQDAIDAFNAPDSQIKIFTLTTRAGGVGINLTTADTVILYDQDFNPMADLQAVSRAHRIGQTKPVTCFKLMVKGSCEEKILAAGKKKLVLEHLIVSRLNMEEREKEEIESVLQFGAKELFEQGDGESVNDIKYNDADIDNLIEQSRQAVEEAGKAKTTNTDNKAFSYAKVWEKQGGLGEMEDKEEEGADAEEQRGFWAAVLAKQQAEQAEKERQKALNMGRGRRQRKQVRNLNETIDFGEGDAKSSPKHEEGKKAKADLKKRRHSGAESEDEDFVFVDDAMRARSPSSDGVDFVNDQQNAAYDLNGLLPPQQKPKKRRTMTPPPEGPALPSGPPISPSRRVSSSERKYAAAMIGQLPPGAAAYAHYVTQPQAPQYIGPSRAYYLQYQQPMYQRPVQNGAHPTQHGPRPPQLVPTGAPTVKSLSQLSRTDQERYARQTERIYRLRKKVHTTGAHHLRALLERIESSLDVDYRHDELAVCKNALRSFRGASPSKQRASNGSNVPMFE